MNQRKQKSSGQAIVMVTLALISMAGMLGLAVDLGWSFFVQKTAQMSADGAALAAVQETYKRNGGGLGTLTCGATADCQTNQPCSAIASSSNLANGCLYALNNGFSSGVAGRNQEVRMTSNVSTPPPTVPGVTDIKYWVTVRTVQVVPQLFSAVLGNTRGTVAAIATAAIAGSITPGSFYGLNHQGDCLTGLGSTIKTPFNCGVDVDVSGSGSANTCLNMDGSSSGVDAKLCAPAGIFLASQCSGASLQGCGTGSATAVGNNFAGQTQGGSARVWAQSGTQISGNGNVNDPTMWKPTNSITRNSSADFSDPTQNLKQPPIVNSSQPSCSVPNGIIPAGTYGPYQYFAVNPTTGRATGAPVTIGNNNVVSFDPGSTACPGTASAAATTGTFQTFTFWGGVNINGNSNTAVNFGAGQYVLAGTTSSTGATLFVDMNGTITGNSSLGTQFLITDGSYSSQGTNLSLPAPLTTAGFTAASFKQGYTDIKNASGNLTGATATSPLSDYQNFLFWNDRRNSNMQIDPDTAAFVGRNRPPTTTDTSPQFVLEPGGMALSLKGVMYQPRGAWTYLNSGGSTTTGNAHLMMVTGALTCGTTGCGSTSVTLLGPSAPIVRYITSLIQ